MHKTLTQIEQSFAKGADTAWPRLSTYGLSAAQARKSQHVADTARHYGMSRGIHAIHITNLALTFISQPQLPLFIVSDTTITAGSLCSSVRETSHQLLTLDSGRTNRK